MNIFFSLIHNNVSPSLSTFPTINKETVIIIRITNDIKAPIPYVELFPNCCCIKVPINPDSPRPSAIPNPVAHGKKTRITPVIIPFKEIGKVTFQKVLNELAPRSSLASYKE